MPTAMNDRGKLDAVYRATRYCVGLPEGQRVTLRVDQPSVEFAAVLKAAGAAHWAIVAAANPGSRILPDEENVRRHGTLIDTVSAAGRVFWSGTNEADDGDWPVEPSLCILDIELQDACRLAATFGQNAIVAGGAEGLPTLVWVSPA